ncbi:RNA-guided endonuclease InsQ/TnpB family protein [Coleofasciculus sp.]|uniref:RNA-guided endonuclease InsQ/TnpB family protein n=1 Tax=Coleofasciculus sp. TaxID=3100458 RepID=UPI0039F76E64
MKTTYQYRIYPQSSQKVQLTESLRICRYWYNRMLGERINWWEQNRCSVNACPLVCHLRELKDRPNYYNQKLQLPVIKEDLVLVKWSGELLNFNGVYSTILQDVCKRVEKAMTRYIQGDKNGKRSGRPRIKNESRYRTMVFDGAKNEWLKFCTVNGKWLYLKLPKIGLVKVRTHRPLPAGFNLKQVSVTKKSDGWYANFVLDAPSVPEFKPEEIVPTWDNSMGIDAVLNEDIYLATSEGKNLHSLKPLRKSLDKLGKLQTKKNPAYTSQLLSYKDEFVFTDCSIRSYWDEELKLWVDRDVNAAINLKRVGLDVFPTIKRRRGNPVVVSSTTNSTAKEVLTVLFKASVAHALP